MFPAGSVMDVTGVACSLSLPIAHTTFGGLFYFTLGNSPPYSLINSKPFIWITVPGTLVSKAPLLPPCCQISDICTCLAGGIGKLFHLCFLDVLRFSLDSHSVIPLNSFTSCCLGICKYIIVSEYFNCIQACFAFVCDSHS